MNAVSVIIPTFNRAQRLARALASVVAQDFAPIEIVVIDDGSTDDTEEVVRSIAAKAPADEVILRYVRQENRGACVARNRGMELATGRYLAFLDSDDLIEPRRLSTQIGVLEREGKDCSICDFDVIDESGAVISHHSNDRHPHEFIRKFISPHISTLILSRDSMLPGLEWNSKLERHQDMDFAFKYLATVKTWSYVKQPLFKYCVHGESRISDSYHEGAQYQIMAESFASHIERVQPLVQTNLTGLVRAYRRELRLRHWRRVAGGLLPHRVQSAIRESAWWRARSKSMPSGAGGGGD